MGRELAALGVNLNFAPVLDIHTNPKNPVIGERAFGQTADAVIAAALPFIEAMQAEKVIACGKHFPGHGDTSIDSHLGLPSQTLGLDALRARELKPFAAAIDAGLSMILMAHILYPAVDAHAPVALSRRFATEILRDELGFPGVAVSDDIGMGAMKGFFDSPDAAVRLIESGCDMVMVCAQFTGTGRARDFAQAILAAAEDGRLDPALLARSRARIENLLARAATNEVGFLPQECSAPMPAPGRTTRPRPSRSSTRPSFSAKSGGSRASGRKGSRSVAFVVSDGHNGLEDLFARIFRKGVEAVTALFKERVNQLPDLSNSHF